MIKSGWLSGAAVASLVSVSARTAFAQVPSAVQIVPPEQRLNFTGVFEHAGVSVKLVMAGLVVAIAASVAIWAFQVLRSGKVRSEPDSAAIGFLAIVVTAGPLFGFAAAGFSLVSTCLGLANVRPTPSLTILAPGLAEAAMSAMLGLFAGAIATAFRGHLQARANGGAGTGATRPT